MEGEAHSDSTQRPKGYTPMPYLPAKKIDTEDKLDTCTRTPLQNSWTFWVKIQEQTYQKKKLGAKFDSDELMELESVDSVSILLSS